MVDDRSDNGLRGRDLIGLGRLPAGCVIVGMVVGYLVDDAAGTEPVGVLVGIGLGILAGIAGFIVKVRAALRGGPAMSTPETSGPMTETTEPPVKASLLRVLKDQRKTLLVALALIV